MCGSNFQRSELRFQFTHTVGKLAKLIDYFMQAIINKMSNFLCFVACVQRPEIQSQDRNNVDHIYYFVCTKIDLKTIGLQFVYNTLNTLKILIFRYLRF